NAAAKSVRDRCEPPCARHIFYADIRVSEDRVRFLACALIALISGSAGAQAASADLDRQIAGCSSFNACFELLDANQNAAIEHAPQFAARLQKFGEPAKQELMKRAVGPEPVKHDWYRAPNFILRYWDDWSERDIEAVDRIIRDNPESPIGWAFVKIGTPRAIKTLVEDAAKYGAPYMPDMIAASFDKSLPYVDEGLAGEYWQFFVYLISDFEMRFALPKQHWLTALRDASQPDGKRIAALSAVSALKKLEPNERDALTP